MWWVCGSPYRGINNMFCQSYTNCPNDDVPALNPHVFIAIFIIHEGLCCNVYLTLFFYL